MEEENNNKIERKRIIRNKCAGEVETQAELLSEPHPQKFTETFFKGFRLP